MTARSPIVLGADGLLQQLQSGDSIIGGGGTSPAPTTATGTGASQNITISAGYTASQLLVFDGGVYQRPGTDYTVSGTTLTGTFTNGNTVSIYYYPNLSNAQVLTTVEINLCSTPQWSGSFTITGAGWTVGQPVYIQQAVGPYTGKGTLADEAEMDHVMVSASVTSSTQITAYWVCDRPVAGNFKFNYYVGG